MKFYIKKELPQYPPFSHEGEGKNITIFPYSSCK